MADRQRIVQVLNNLFSNAAKHSSQSLPIRVAAERKDLHVEISVTDEGKGVSPELLPRLFRKYTRVGGSDRGIGGSGLGLAICKGLVEAHGGRIRVESGGEGLGACFTFTIPVAEETGTGAVDGLVLNSPRSAWEVLGQSQILVVDDDPRTLRYVRDALVAEGYSPILTGNPDEVPHLVVTEQPRLVLMDLMLPGTTHLLGGKDEARQAEHRTVVVSGILPADVGPDLAKFVEVGEVGQRRASMEHESPCRSTGFGKRARPRTCVSARTVLPRPGDVKSRVRQEFPHYFHGQENRGSRFR